MSNKPVKNLFFSLFFIGFIVGLFSLYQIYKTNPKVELIGLGFSRSGTSILFDTLEKHSKVNVLRRVYDRKGKVVGGEINYFGNLSDKSYVRVGIHGIERKKIYKPPIKYYKSLIKKQLSNVEKSPQYIWKKETLEKIYKYNPKVKVVVQVRNPLDWLWSYYQKSLACQDDLVIDPKMSFEEFLKAKHGSETDKTLEDCAGSFMHYIHNVFEIFPKENIYVISINHLHNFKTMNELSKFLDLPLLDEDITIHFCKAQSYNEKICADTYEKLKAKFNPKIEEINNLLVTCNQTPLKKL